METNDGAYVGLLTYNTRSIVLENIEGLLASGLPPHALVVWDNASTDGTDKEISDRFPSIRYIQSKENLGYSGGMNGVVAALDAPYVVLMTADCFATHLSINQLIESLASKPEAAICGGRLIDGRTGLVQSEGKTLTFPLGIGLPIKGDEPADTPAGPPVEVPYVDGAFLGLNVEVFHSLGGFDEQYFAYHEEADLCWRARLQGYRVICDPSASATHLTHASWGPFTERRWQLMERNRIFTNLKNMNCYHATVAILTEIAYGIGLEFLTPILGPRGYTQAYARALIDVWTHLRAIRAKRAAVQKTRLRSDADVLKLHPRIGPRALFKLLNLQRRLFYVRKRDA